MKERIKTIKHKGKDIIYVELSRLHPSEHIEVLDEYKAYVRANFKKEEVLCIFDFNNTRINAQSKAKAKSTDKQLESEGYTMKIVSLGITGVQKVIIKSLKRNFVIASTLEEAKELATK